MERLYFADLGELRVDASKASIEVLGQVCEVASWGPKPAYVYTCSMTRSAYMAHSVNDRPEQDWHRLADHLEATATVAQRDAAKLGAPTWGKAAALLHDAGK